jgi:predicted nucleic acid-binding protein
MSARHFVDTNVLVYAHQANAGSRHRVAAELVTQLWLDRTGVVSTQVLQELYVNLRRRIDPPLGIDEAARIVDDYLAWRLVVNDGDAIRQAIVYEKRYKLSFWDALIVQAANSAGADTLYTEDLNHGQRYGQVLAVDPFA